MPDPARTFRFTAVMFLASAATSWAQPDCNHELVAMAIAPVDFSTNSAVINESLRPKWNPDLFSDPHHHNPNDYKYIIRVPDGNSAETIRADVKKKILSTSLIAKYPSGEKFTGSFAGKGWAIILRVPEANMVANLFKDSGVMSTTNSSRSETVLKDYESRFGFYTPDALIRRSIEWSRKYPKKPYNELFIRGGEGVAQPVAIIGLVRFIGRLGSWETAEENDVLVHKLSQELGVPVVDIEQ